MTLKDMLKYLYSGSVVVVESKMDKYSKTYLIYAPIPTEFYKEPLITVGVESKFVKPKDAETAQGSNMSDKYPEGWLISTAQGNEPETISKEVKKPSITLPEEITDELKKQYPTITKEKLKKLKNNKEQIEGWLKGMIEVAKEFQLLVVNNMGTKMLADYNWFFASGMTPEKGIPIIAELSGPLTNPKGAELGFKLHKAMQALDLSPKNVDSYKKLSTEAFGRAMKRWGTVLGKGLLKGAGKALKAVGKGVLKELGKTGTTAKQAFSTGLGSSWGGVDISSYVPSINGHKLITDSSPETKLEAYTLSTPLEFSKLKVVLDGLEGYVSWIKPKDNSLIFYTIKGSSEPVEEISSISALEDGSFSAAVLLDKELRAITDAVSIDIKDNNIILR
jgi:hypothetical protein